jgi:DNA polymerase-3 subunit delta
MREIKRDIANKTFRHIYLLYGEESYMIRECKKMLVSAIAGEDTMNLFVSEEGMPELKTLKNFLDTFPLFADYRLAVINDSGLFSKASDGFDELLKNLPETAIIIFAEKKVDKRVALFKMLSKLDAYICELKEADDRTRQLFVIGRLKAAGKKITQDTYNELVRREGESMENLSSELEKLIAFSGDRELITTDDIEAICSPHPEDRIFAMIDSAIDGDRKKAMELYYDLLALKVPPVKIISILGGQCNKLYLASQMQGGSQAEIAAALKIPPFAAGRLLQKSRRAGESKLLSMLSACVDHEYMVKSGRMEETVAAERLIVMLCSGHIKNGL